MNLLIVLYMKYKYMIHMYRKLMIYSVSDSDKWDYERKFSLLMFSVGSWNSCLFVTFRNVTYGLHICFLSTGMLIFVQISLTTKYKRHDRLSRNHIPHCCSY